MGEMYSDWGMGGIILCDIEAGLTEVYIRNLFKRMLIHNFVEI